MRSSWWVLWWYEYIVCVDVFSVGSFVFSGESVIQCDTASELSASSLFFAKMM